MRPRIPWLLVLKDSVSTGARAGIAVGIAVGTLIALITGVWLLLKRRDKRNAIRIATEPGQTTSVMEYLDVDLQPLTTVDDWRSIL